jgi:SAM-dependent methyltransferase
MKNPTRGSGLLEGFLARKRCQKAMSLIPGELHGGRVLDIGCSAYPFFLIQSPFGSKYGVDRIIDTSIIENYKARNIFLESLDVAAVTALPYDDDFFSVVVMLAVIEHLEPECFVPLCREIVRTLRPGGVFIITTPSFWTEWILFVMKTLRLVSPEEIDEHKDAYSPDVLTDYLVRGGFQRKNIEAGYFECFMNTYVRAEKTLDNRVE